MATIQDIKALAPNEHHAAIDAALAGCDAAKVSAVGGFLQALVALLKQIGANINWACVLSIIPQAIAAFSNPALWVSVITAYFACAAGPTPAP